MPLAHRRAQRLAQVALGDHAVEGRGEAGAAQLLAHQIELGLGFLHARHADRQLGAVALGHGRAVGVAVLRQLTLPFAQFQEHVLPRQLDQHLVALHRVAGTGVNLLQEAVGGRRQDALHLAFDARRGGHAMWDRHRQEYQQDASRAPRDQLGPIHAGFAQARDARHDQPAQAPPPAFLGMPLEHQQGRQQADQVLQQHLFVVVEGGLARGLQGDRAVHAALGDHGQGDDGPLGGARQRGMGQGDAWLGLLGGRKGDRRALVDGLLHGRFQLAIRLAARVGMTAVGHGDDAHGAPLGDAQADPPAVEDGRHFVGEGDAGRLETRVRQHRGMQAQGFGTAWAGVLQDAQQGIELGQSLAQHAQHRIVGRRLLRVDGDRQGAGGPVAEADGHGEDTVVRAFRGTDALDGQLAQEGIARRRVDLDGGSAVGGPDGGGQGLAATRAEQHEAMADARYLAELFAEPVLYRCFHVSAGHWRVTRARKPLFSLIG